MAYVMQKRLGWTPSPKSTAESGPLFDYEDPTPFQDPRDFRVMPNDWPYGLDKGIVHVIVWLKNRLQVEPPRGDLTAGARTQVLMIATSCQLFPLCVLIYQFAAFSIV